MFLIFDTETTGLPLRDNAPIEELDNWPRMVQIAWQLHDESGAVLEHKNLIVKPEGFEIPYKAEKVHGISTKKAMEEGLPLSTVLVSFNAALAQSTVVIGHNVSFDEKIVAAEFLRAKIASPFRDMKKVCTMWSGTDFTQIKGGRGGGYKPPKLMELYTWLFEESFDEAHNAAADVDATARCFFEMYRRKIIPFDTLGIDNAAYQKFIETNQGVVEKSGLTHASMVNWSPMSPSKLSSSGASKKLSGSPSSLKAILAAIATWQKLKTAIIVINKNLFISSSLKVN